MAADLAQTLCKLSLCSRIDINGNEKQDKAKMIDYAGEVGELPNRSVLLMSINKGDLMLFLKQQIWRYFSCQY